MDAKTLLKAENISRSYHGQAIVEGLNLTLNHGKVTGLLGPNGAGKSTTLKMLAGILAPSGGIVRVLDKDVYQYPRQKRHIGYLPEHPPLYAELTILEQLNFTAGLHDLPRNFKQTRIDTVLENCQLSEEKNKLIGQLSKGYRQRVGLAQSLLHEASIILLDEPTDGLDPLQIQSFRELIEQLSSSHTLLISSHQLNEVTHLCDHVIIMKQGRSIYSGTMEEITAAGDSLEQRFTRLIYAPQEEQAA
jgi:ABC-2 type transport system ATP-binding protein